MNLPKFRNIIRFIQNLKFLFLCHYWIMNEPYSLLWDMRLNKLLDECKFERRYWGDGELRIHAVILGKTELWVSNYPYSCFMPVGANYRASRRTILRAYKRLISDLKEGAET